jgi:hypothetical protein
MIKLHLTVLFKTLAIFAILLVLASLSIIFPKGFIIGVILAIIYFFVYFYQIAKDNR